MFPLLHPSETTPEVLHPDVEPQHKKDMQLLEMFRGLECLSCEGKLRDLGFFSLGMRRVWEDHTVFQSVMTYRKAGEDKE